MMSRLDSRFALGLDGSCYPDCVVQGEKYRFTVLTSRMLRMEYAEDGVFEDRPTQVVWNRKLGHPEFKVLDQPELLEIDTEYFHLVYDKKTFDPNHLYIDVKYNFTNYGGRWYYGRTDYGNPPRDHNLGGTARTLDRCDGAWYEPTSCLDHIHSNTEPVNRSDGDVDLGRGLCDTSGRAFFEDGASLIIDEEGWVQPRRKGCIDTYFFGYGRDYFGAIRDFYRLSGATPLLPKYVLGNWWSRYWKYTEESYMALLTRFEKLDIPFSVVVMDMDWHLVDVPEKYGKGWTGYTWNRDFFPDPDRFLNWLHAHDYHITLNLHPADGVRAYEEQYPEMARALGVDPETEFPVRFDFTNKEFIDAYFKYLHHPNEERGVDFWWMDWQQGNVSAVEGMDPLWMLNHYHHYDLERNGKRAVMLSRYSGLGSHRYPMGFSGDTYITWQSLQYQPYFTATAANVGYTWWSHDIGGHMNGIKNYELYVRWLQFGIFSPINRLHSNTNPFGGKEPWHYPKPYDEIAEETLRLRHRMLPYTYTLNYQCHAELKPNLVPVYYYYPMEEDCYQYRNEYFYGSELLVQPMVHPTDPATGYTAEPTWLPPGIWTDVYEGAVYHGGEHGACRTLNRSIHQQGVLAKPGAIVPMAQHEVGSLDLDNPETLEIYVFPGADNQFELFEDTGDGFGYEAGECVKTCMTLQWSPEHSAFCIEPKGDFSVLPATRHYILHFRGFQDVPEAEIRASEAFRKSYDAEKRTLTLCFEGSDVRRTLSVTLDGRLLPEELDFQAHLFDVLDMFQGDAVLKKAVMKCFEQAKTQAEIVSGLMGLDLPESWRSVLMEMAVR